jgi:hypothetical protein
VLQRAPVRPERRHPKSLLTGYVVSESHKLSMHTFPTDEFKQRLSIGHVGTIRNDGQMRSVIGVMHADDALNPAKKPFDFPTPFGG